MPFKLSSKGDNLLLWYTTNHPSDNITTNDGTNNNNSGADDIDGTGDDRAVIEAPILVDCWNVPALGENEVFARFPDGVGAPQQCPYASAGKRNPEVCSADVIDATLTDAPATFTPFIWEVPFMW